ncbi:tetratricopeptide repeat protein [Marinobacter sp.]|uniref:tetratricopeptide repeat protein n=1 Tax=Marinobacter sp. TaxID=50741 RepID=UPI003565F839
MLVFWRALSLFLLLMPTMILQAAETDAGMEDFHAGVEAFEAGDLSAAKQRFQSAADAGLASPSLFYNLGVVCYQLGDYVAAESAFRALLDGSNGALASYNLGLVALAREAPVEARHWFEQASSEKAPDKVRTLARAQLNKLADGVPPSAGQPSIRGYLGISGGYDSNIAGLPEDTVSSEGGGFLEALAAGTFERPVGTRSRIALDAAAYSREHPSDDEYDTQVLQGRITWSETLAAGERGALVSLVKSWFDSQSLETRSGIEGFYRWRQCPLPAAPDQCGISLAAATVNGGSGFEAYDGQWYRARLHGLKYLGSWRFDGEYSLEINDRRDLRTADEFVSVSPTHHTLKVASRYRWQPDLALGATGSVRHSRYQDDHQLVTAAGESGRREDNRLEIGLLVERSLDSRWLVRGEWLVRNTRSSLSQYEYQRQTLMLTLEGAF